MTPKPEERVSILAVDDSPEKLLALSAVLSELNHNVVTAASGREALRQLLKQEFAVVLLDVNMPGLDGFETAAIIRQGAVASTPRSSSSRRTETSPTRCAGIPSAPWTTSWRPWTRKS